MSSELERRQAERIGWLEGENERLRKDVAELKTENRKLRLILARQPIPVEYTQYDPKRFESVRELILNVAPFLTRERFKRGFFDWKWTDMKNHVERITKKRFNAETVARVCRRLAEDDELMKTGEGRYVWRAKETER